MARNVHGDRGAAAVEAGLLMVAILVVLLPVAFALGALVRASFTHACPAPGGCVTPTPGAPALHSGPGSQGGAVDAQQATAQVEAAAGQQLHGQHPETAAPDVSCPSFAPWPPAGTEVVCTATYPAGETTSVTVRFTDGEGHITLVG